MVPVPNFLFNWLKLKSLKKNSRVVDSGRFIPGPATVNLEIIPDKTSYHAPKLAQEKLKLHSIGL